MRQGTGAVMMNNVCAYCGQALRVVAGFCATCQAPVEIASHAKLVARELRATHSALVMGSAASLPPLTLPSAPQPRMPTRLLLCGGIVALALVVVAISLRLGVNPIRALVAPSGGELAASMTAGGAAVTTVAAGTTFTLHYAVSVASASALVTLSITPADAPTRSLTERWPRGTTQRSQSLVAMTPGNWHISIARDGVTLSQIDLTILPAPTAMTNHSPTSATGSAVLASHAARVYLTCIG